MVTGPLEVSFKWYTAADRSFSSGGLHLADNEKKVAICETSASDVFSDSTIADNLFLLLHTDA